MVDAKLMRSHGTEVTWCGGARMRIHGRVAPVARPWVFRSGAERGQTLAPGTAALMFASAAVARSDARFSISTWAPALAIVWAATNLSHARAVRCTRRVHVLAGLLRHRRGALGEIGGAILGDYPVPVVQPVIATTCAA
ncbi:hypothetical protein T484DRAFT_1742818 [Baffinella frigidus]|nr:hypothetical protein T484DRAFT_1742818 [Cryptophyta sp. CCMP2293]